MNARLMVLSRRCSLEEVTSSQTGVTTLDCLGVSLTREWAGRLGAAWRSCSGPDCSHHGGKGKQGVFQEQPSSSVGH